MERLERNGSRKSNRTGRLEKEGRRMMQSGRPCRDRTGRCLQSKNAKSVCLRLTIVGWGGNALYP